MEAAVYEFFIFIYGYYLGSGLWTQLIKTSLKYFVSPNKDNEMETKNVFIYEIDKT